MMPQGIIAAQAGMMERPAYLDLLTRVVYPVLFIAGKHDTRIPVDKIMAQAMLPCIRRFCSGQYRAYGLHRSPRAGFGGSKTFLREGVVPGVAKNPEVNTLPGPSPNFCL